jgi:hypothetical protein
MKLKLLFITFFLFPTVFLFGKNSCRDTVKVGMYITSFRNIDFSNSSFCVDAWLWFHYKNRRNLNNKFFEDNKPKIYNYLEFPDAVDPNNGGQPSYKNDDIDSSLNTIWETVKISSPFRKKWDLTNYPFDVQNVNLILESSDFSCDYLILDTLSAQIDSTYLLNEKEWYFANFKYSSKIRNYQTNFGNPNVELTKETDYSNVCFSFDLIRSNRWVTFMKLYTGILISFLLALSVFFIKPTNLDARYGLCVGGLFSAIGSKYIVDSMIPMNYQNTLFDHIHNVTFVYIFIITIISIITLKMFESENLEKHFLARKIDLLGFTICLSSYLVIIVMMVLDALVTLNYSIIFTTLIVYFIIVFYLIIYKFLKFKF